LLVMSERPPVEPPRAEPPARTGIPTSTIVVGAILIAVVGFGVGFVVGHRTARPAFPFARYGHLGAMPWMRAGTMPGIGMPGYGGSVGGGGLSGTNPTLPSGDRIVAGTVTDVRGGTFTLRTLRGDSVTVVTSSSTVVRGLNGDALAVLRPGDRVLVAGVPQADGSIAATHVLEGLFGSAMGPLPGAPTSNASG
jgi:hypothetical protein